MDSDRGRTFQSLSENVGQFRLRDKIFLIPEMNRIGGHLLAGTFRGFGVNAMVMETYQGIDLGKEFTSGKECFPCQVTTGDILLFMKKEKERLGEGFNAENYIYFMPEAEGPCRFGMYNKYQRIVLDSFPELRKLKIGALTSKNSYSLDGMFDEGQSRELRKVAYFSVVVADVLDRLLWRIRPYERAPGEVDAFIEKAMHSMSRAFEELGPRKDFDSILEMLEEVIEEGTKKMDPAIPPKPLVGIVGEIYLRTHVHAIQQVIRVLEKYGAEVVNASIAEWVNYTTYDRMREAKIGLRLHLKQLKAKEVKAFAKKILGEDLYSFDVGTEACLSIPGIIEYVREGFNGVVNVYPFTCMPSTITSSIVKPIMNRMKVPYLDTPYDGTYQPGREAAIRTFMYQAQQHFERNGRKYSNGHG
ncbi:MAG: CoA activase [Deltaproteobacteria bacterium]